MKKIQLKNYLLGLILMLISFSAYSQNWHLVRLDKIGTLELPATETVMRTDTLQYVFCQTEKMTIQIVNSTLPGKIEPNVVKIPAKRAKELLQEFTERYLRGENYQILYQLEIDVQSMKGMDLGFKDPSGELTYMRMLIVNNCIVIMGVKANKSHKEIAEVNKDRLFESLTLF
ncbi:hypothetical protein QNI19_26240 [Cytophagaceae bacterium DM2B3-1]|uniref:DUF1795 domain-containing protein n=1 Tax=Xanthocytophaga flava TaxID=3048013 RepID=A0ABT7CRV2_9BACT|nr:hypothetical protein [Xanthocytophaga flavus]MDJ1496463.1 hypothetical protein [Xanthocytophaga flavus]